MASDTFDYRRMIARSLRGVAREALAHTAEHGLPGEHHFYLSFRTRGDGVRVPGFLADQYPDEMTVVLQNQFWDLVVDDEAFSVSLTFQGARQRVVVPWDSLTAFADPSAQLGLRFEPESDDAEAVEGDEAAAATDDDTPTSPFASAAPAPDDHADGGDAAEGENAKVVHFDRFRRRAEADGADDAGEAADVPAVGEEVPTEAEETDPDS